MTDPSLVTTSLRSYLLKSQTYLSLLILAVCVVGMTSIAAHTFKRYSEYNLQLIAQSFSEQIQMAVLLEDKRTIDDTIKIFMQKYPLQSIQVINMTGEIIANSAEPLPIYRTDAALLESIQTWLISDHAGYTNVVHNAQILAQVKVTNSIFPLISFLKLFVLFFIISLGGVLFLITFSTNLIYRNIDHSLATLTLTTESIIAKRNFTQRVPHSHIAEFNTISESFNALLNEIQTWQAHLQQENSHLEYRALHDILTQLPNRAYFNQRLAQLFEHPNTRRHFALLYIDNNSFKEINDTYGHQAGDAVLQEMAIRLKRTLRSNDFIARIGGDEFAVLLLNISKPMQAMTAAKNLLRVGDTPLQFENTSIQFGFSIGVALSVQADSIEQLIHQADQAMYQAKANTPQKLAIYTPIST